MRGAGCGVRNECVHSELRIPNSELRRGLTLIEVLVSVVILSAGAIVLMQSLAQSAHAQAIAEAHIQAYVLAASKLGELELEAARGESLPERQEGIVRVGQQTFNWSATATALEASPVQAVSLLVSWKEGARDYTLRLDTAIRASKPAP